MADEIEPNVAASRGHTQVRLGGKVNSRGDQTQYVIHLRDNALRAAAKQSAHLAAPRPAEAKENLIDKRGWHRKEVRHLIDLLERQYGFAADSITSWVAATAVVYLTPEQAEVIARDERVYEVEQIDASVKMSFSSIWNDRYDGNELVTWGKQAIGTDDLLTTSNLMYTIDRTPLPHPDLVINVAPVNSPGVWNGRDHGLFVAGIMAAKANGAHSRGVNPNAPNFWSVEAASQSAIDLRTAVDFILAHSEQAGMYGSTNISFNGSGIFRFDQSHGKLVRRLSTRSFVAQSAGNFGPNNSACEYAYCSPQLHGYYGTPTRNTADGIVVVGGINADNQQELSYNNSQLIFPPAGLNPFFGDVPGSTAGHCVEMWAPSTTYSTVTYYPGSSSSTPIYEKFQAKGTSFAAPHVTALAARYGGPNTTPVQREAYLRSKLQHTGNTDSLYEPIYKPNYLAPPLFTIPSRLAPTYISASSSTASSDLWSTQDTLYLSGNYWNAGSQNGWIQFDLGQLRTLTSIRLVPEMSGFGNARHEVLVSDGVNPFTSAQIVNEYAETLSPISMSLNNAQARYVRVKSSLTALTWISWREVEIYGN
jgi:Subtilase family/F5/8 type C domain